MPSQGRTVGGHDHGDGLVSSLLRLPVRRDVAMTGEITLRGRVMPIGGLKDKILAAHRAEIYKVIIPNENRKDLKDIPKRVLKMMKIVPWSTWTRCSATRWSWPIPRRFSPDRAPASTGARRAASPRRPRTTSRKDN